MVDRWKEACRAAVKSLGVMFWGVYTLSHRIATQNLHSGSKLHV